MVVPAGLAVLAPLLAGCGGGGPSAPLPRETRTFRMALSPFPPDTSVGAFIATVDYVVENADAVLHQEDGGVPWNELIAGDPLPAALAQGIAYRAERTRAAGRLAFVATSPLDAARAGIAPQWGTGEVPPPLAGAALRDTLVQRSFVDWCLYLVDAYDPDLFAPILEANIHAVQDPAGWSDLVDLYGKVYTAVKAARPGLPVFPTLQLEYLRGDLPLPGSPPQWSLLGGLAPQLDRLALSTYPIAAGRSADSLGASYLADAIARARPYTIVPVIVSETGWPSETVTVGGVTYPGSLEGQRAYLASLLASAEENQLDLVTWLFPIDFPDLFEVIEERLPPGEAEGLRLFVPMGLNEESGAPKPAEAVWRETFARGLGG